MTGTLITRGNVLAEGTNTDARMVKASNSVHGVALYTSSTQRGLYDTKSSKFIFYQGTSNNTVHAVLPLVLDTDATFQVTDGASIFGGTVALNEDTTLASAKYLYFGGTTYYINGSGTAKLNGLTAGNTSITGTLGVTGATTTQNITPAVNATYNLGSSAAKWSNVYATTFQGNATSASKWATARTITLKKGAAGSVSLDGSADRDLEVTSVYEGYLAWGGKNYYNKVSPLGAALSAEHSANRIAYLKPSALSFETSTDAGSTWTELTVTDEDKTKLVTLSGALHVGPEGIVTTNNRTRMTLSAYPYVYFRPRKMLINCTDNGHGISVTIEIKKGTSEATWETVGTYKISGWSGWNEIPLSFAQLGGNSNQPSNYWFIRLTFAVTAVNASTSYASRPSAILAIRMFGEECWSPTCAMGNTGHLYNYDANKKATFPGEVAATSFSGSGASLTSLNANNISSGTLSVGCGGTGATTFTAGAALIGNGTGAIQTRLITNNTFATAVTASTDLITANTLYYHTGNSNIVTVGTITSGTWQGNTIAVSYGGTGKTSWTANALVYANTATSLGQIDLGTSGYVLQSNGSANAPSWINTTSNNTASTIVKRDASGNFSAGTITATLSGNASTASTWKTARNFTIGAATKSVNGSADVSWTVPETGAISHWSLGKGYTFLWGSQDSDTNWKTIATYQDVSTNATTSKWNGATVKGIIHYVTSNMHDGQVVDIPFTATFTSYAGNGTTANPLAPADRARLYIPASCTVDIIRIVRVAVNHFELQMRVPALYKWVRTQFSIAGTVSLVKVPAEIATTTNTSAAVVADYQNNFIRLTDAKYAYYDGTDATGTWAISITGSADSAATAIKLTNAKTFITDLASTTAGSFDGSANVSLGVTGVLPLSNGGTGNTAMTANRLVWSEDATKLTAGYHYASSTKIAINSTSAPAETFYVNGSTKINGALTATSLNLTTIEKTMSLSTQDYWYDTGIIGSHLATGTYIIQISRVDSNKTEYWSGIMSWCSTADSNPNDAERYNEIVLHNAGEYPGSVSHIMARTVRTTSGTKLQLCVSGTTMSSLKITFKCAKII